MTPNEQALIEELEEVAKAIDHHERRLDRERQLRNQIIIALAEKGISRREIGRRCGMSHVQVGNVLAKSERNQEPS